MQSFNCICLQRQQHFIYLTFSCLNIMYLNQQIPSFYYLQCEMCNIKAWPGIQGVQNYFCQIEQVCSVCHMRCEQVKELKFIQVKYFIYKLLYTYNLLILLNCYVDLYLKVGSKLLTGKKKRNRKQMRDLLQQVFIFYEKT